MILAITMRANAASLNGVSVASRSGVATAQSQTANPTSSYTYNYMYPYLNNKMRTTLKPFDATAQSTSPINAIVKTEALSAPRRVVSRPTAPVARAATTSARRVVARTATNARTASGANYSGGNTSPRRVVSRAAIAQINNSNTSRAQNTPEFPTEAAPRATSSVRCLADYTECMNGYCERANTAYNRCYCSARLAQIDAEYQPQIEKLIMQIAALKSGASNADINELNEYWSKTVGQYSGTSAWSNIDDALNIDWASMESRVRGQNAFITGHEYCSQYLAGCFYMASNLRDVYRSSIAQDCSAYESSLNRLKTVAESVIQGYQE